MIELAVFLGNPGKEYSRNRHNVGFLLAENLPFNKELSWQKKYKGLYTAIERNLISGYVPDSAALDKSDISGRLHFLKPETYMNLSGESVSKAAGFFKIKSQSILVVHDELELPFGTISLKYSGGLGGHKGLRSMKACLGTADFWRIKIGIGRPDNRLPGEGGPPGSGEGIVDWVLSDFTVAENETLKMVLEAGTELLLKTFFCEPEGLLKEWQKKKISLPAILD